MPIFDDYETVAGVGISEPNTGETLTVANSWCAIVAHWSVMTDELSRIHHLDLHDPTVQTRPWVGVRNMILSLLETDTRLRAALTRR